MSLCLMCGNSALGYCWYNWVHILKFDHNWIEGYESKAVMRISIMSIEVGLFIRHPVALWGFLMRDKQAKEDVWWWEHVFSNIIWREVCCRLEMRCWLFSSVELVSLTRPCPLNKAPGEIVFVLPSGADASVLAQFIPISHFHSFPSKLVSGSFLKLVPSDSTLVLSYGSKVAACPIFGQLKVCWIMVEGLDVMLSKSTLLLWTLHFAQTVQWTTYLRMDRSTEMWMSWLLPAVLLSIVTLS